MKKIVLGLIVMMTAAIGFAQDMVVIEDFDFERNLNTWIPDSGAYIFTVTDEPGSAINTVGRYDLSMTQITEGAAWLGSRVDGIMGGSGAWSGYGLDDYPYFTIDVYCSEGITLGLKAEEGCCGDPKPSLAEDYVDYIYPGHWQTLVFDLSAGVGFGSDVEVVILIDSWNTDTEKTIYFDNYTAYKTLPDVTLVGTKDLVADANIEVFPNPASDQVTFTYNETTNGPLDLVITDMLGNEVYRANDVDANGGIDVDASAYAPGMYVYAFESAQSRYTNTFIVK